MLVLFESPAGYAVFKLLNEKKLQEVDDLYKEFESADAANKMVKLKHFAKFSDMTEALSAATAAVEGKMSKRLKKVLKKVYASEAHEQLAVADAKLGSVIKEKLDIACVHSAAISELFRGIRSQMCNLISGLPQSEVNTMALGLSHSLSRYKLKFSPDKVDVMIIQAIALLDDLDKELNNYNMRCREWYGWHFPELGKMVTDNLTYARLVKVLGMRGGVVKADLASVLDEEMEEEVRAAAEVSMGTEISQQDMDNICHLCEQVIEISDYRAQLYEYLKNRMMAIAPNLTMMVGELVGARLIAHAGSLMNLAKHPSSTVQILGAEKALFRALKTKHDTPKYGLIYGASLVGQTAPKNKGKISRMLAAKASLCVRVDALGEDSNDQIGVQSRTLVERRLHQYEQIRKISGTGKIQARAEKYDMSATTGKKYNEAKDFKLEGTGKKRKREEEKEEGVGQEEGEESVIKTEGSTKKSKKLKLESTEQDSTIVATPTPKKSKKKHKVKSDEEVQVKEEVAITPEVVQPKKKKDGLKLLPKPFFFLEIIMTSFVKKNYCSSVLLFCLGWGVAKMACPIPLFPPPSIIHFNTWCVASSV